MKFKVFLTSLSSLSLASIISIPIITNNPSVNSNNLVDDTTLQADEEPIVFNMFLNNNADFSDLSSAITVNSVTYVLNFDTAWDATNKILTIKKVNESANMIPYVVDFTKLWDHFRIKALVSTIYFSFPGAAVGSAIGFNNSKNVKKVIFPKQAQFCDPNNPSESPYYLGGCSALEEVIFDNETFQTDNNNYLPDSMFCNCSALTKVILPPKLSEIPTVCFYNCYSLTSLNIPSSVSAIQILAFQGMINDNLKITIETNYPGNLVIKDPDRYNKFYSTHTGLGKSRVVFLFNSNEIRDLALTYEWWNILKSFILPYGQNVTILGADEIRYSLDDNSFSTDLTYTTQVQPDTCNQFLWLHLSEPTISDLKVDSEYSNSNGILKYGLQAKLVFDNPQNLNPGQYKITLTAFETNSDIQNVSAEKEITLIVTKNPQSLTINGDSNLTGTKGMIGSANYIVSPTPDDATNWVDWSLENAPSGVSIDNDGVLTWTDNLAPNTYNFIVKATSQLASTVVGQKAISLTIPQVVPTSITIEGQDHLSGIAGSNGSSQYVAILNPDNADGNVTWSLNNDANSNITINPTGLLVWNNNITQGTYNLIITATSSLDSSIVAHKNVTLTIDYATPTAISINGDANLLGTVKVSGSSSYTATVLPNNANPNVTWSLQDNNEADKITINEQGVLSWNDSLNPGTYQFNIIATSVQTTSLFASKIVTLTISYANPVLGDISLTKTSGDATINANVISQILGTTSTFNANCNINNSADIDPSLPKTWSINNAPSGVSVDGSSGLMTINNPSYGNNQTISITYTVGNVSKNATYVLNVAYASPIFGEITLAGDGVLDDHNINLALNQTATITATCNVSNSQYVDPSLTSQWSLKNQPSGVSIDATSGIISIPNNLAKDNYSFSIVYRYGSSTKESNVNLEIGYELPRLSSISLTNPENLTIQDHNVKVNYHQAASFQARCDIINIDQIDPNLTLQWSLLNAPSGVSIDQNGLVKIASNTDAINDWSLQIICHVGKITSVYDINLSIIKSNPSIVSNPIFWAVLIPFLVIILIIILVVLFDYRRRHNKK